ncbi:MAG TPA: VWA domain-containing protein [Terriglobales bacterium]|nr:VWA domain-containing protein [Terriglobales bacterium]
MNRPSLPPRSGALWTALLLMLVLVFSAAGLVAAAPPQDEPKPAEKKAEQKPDEAGGPNAPVGPIAVPKRKEEAPPPEPARRPGPSDMPDYSLRVDVPLVNVDVLVLTKDGQFVPGLKKEHFRVLEDGVPQKITNFGQSEAPITAVLVVEFASTYYDFVYDALNASYQFASTLKPQDWVAVVAFDMKPRIMVDFTQNKGAIYGALGQLRMPGFSETNVFDALYDTLDRIDGIEGRKYVILVSRGIDTFSKITLDRTLKKIRETRDVTIFTISTGEALRLWAESHGMIGPITSLEFLQADNQMRHFAEMTGGRWYKPRFEGEFPGIFREIAAITRNQYTLSYHPTNRALDGSYRKIKVELVAPDGSGPLKVKNEKNKDVKVQIIAREGYTARHVVD